MKKKDVEKLELGVYRIFWKGWCKGSSVAAVGNTTSGKKWIAPSNWLSKGTTSRKVWKSIKRAELLGTRLSD